MKARPILYSRPMVQGVLDERKKQTRRTRGLDIINKSPDDWRRDCIDIYIDSKGRVRYIFFNIKGSYDERLKCPYGQLYDLLYVKETCSFFMQGNGRIQREKTKYKADEKWGNNPLIKWTPSIHMPKAAERIWLQITNIRIERLKDITEHDAIAEGIERLHTVHWWKNYMNDPLPGTSSSVESFKSLWLSINGRQSWDVNLWVWVIEFKVISKTGFDAIPEDIRKELAA